MRTWWNNQTLFGKLGLICIALAITLTGACFKYRFLAVPAVGFSILTCLCSLAMALEFGKPRTSKLTSHYFAHNDTITLDELPPDVQEDIKIAIARATLEA